MGSIDEKLTYLKETKNKIKEAILSCGEYSDGMPLIVEKDDFKDAVIAAKNLADAGDTVILTPASASFDRFKNFEERGDRFKNIVNSF